ncbi:hypothetical protein BD413DRAFT_167704 [Trametes elegans]|nr:hypothetical protein BD413DRAFT_167704 [Trametes elegans]
MAIHYPHTMVTDGLNICVTKIYTNSLLSVLIHRQFLPQREYNSAETSLTESEQDDRFHTRTHSQVSPSLVLQPRGPKHCIAHTRLTAWTSEQGSTGSLSVLHIKVTQDVVRDTHSVGTVSEDAHHHYHGYDHDRESKGSPEYSGVGAGVQFTWRPAAGAVATV